MKLSIVIPVYNAGRFLRETLDSILAQTFQDFQVIAVDDGSTDDSRQILDECLESFGGRLTLLSQENQGGWAARNAGIPYIEGEFVVFFDADDVMEPECLQKLVSCQEQTGAELVDGGRTIIDETGAELVYKGFEEIREAAGEPLKLLFVERTDPEVWQMLMHLAAVPGTKLYRTDLIRKYGITFGRTRIGQDLNFYLKYLAVCKSAALLDESICRYRWHPDSISHEAGEKLLDISGCLDDASRFAKKCGAELFFRQEFYNVRIQHYYFQLQKCIRVSGLRRRLLLFDKFSRGILRAGERGGSFVNEKYRTVCWKVKKLHRIRFLLACFPGIYQKLVDLYRMKKGTTEYGRLADIA